MILYKQSPKIFSILIIISLNISIYSYTSGNILIQKIKIVDYFFEAMQSSINDPVEINSKISSIEETAQEYKKIPSLPRKSIDSDKRIIEINNIKDITFQRFLNSDMTKFDLSVTGYEKKFLQYKVFVFFNLSNKNKQFSAISHRNQYFKYQTFYHIQKNRRAQCSLQSRNY